MTVYFDYRFRFTDLARALGAIAALRTAGILSAGELPANMLGTQRDAAGKWTADSDKVAFCGEHGRPGGTFIDDNGDPQSFEAVGDPAYWYIHVRSVVDPRTIPFDPASFGLEVSDPAESASVLGVWA